jgi:excisionase family DNA binding protein
MHANTLPLPRARTPEHAHSDRCSLTESQHEQGLPDRLLIDADELARLLGVSVRHVRRMDAGGEIPRAVRLGRSVRWRRDEIIAWIVAGVPDRDRWETLRRLSRK